MTAAYGLRAFALVLSIAMVVRAQQASEAAQDAGSLPTWNDACSLSVRGAIVRWAVGDSGCILKTINGDTTARYVIGNGQSDLCGVSFADAQHGWIVGNMLGNSGCGRGIVFRTTTGGGTSPAWTASCPVIRPDVNVPFLEVEALDVRHVWVTCGDGYMFYSNDGGLRWAVTAKRSGSDELGSAGSGHAK